MTARKYLSALALISLVTVAACGGGGEDTSAPAAAAAPTATAPDLSNAGGIAGNVTFSGDAPAAEAIAMAADPFCQASHSEAVMSSPVLVDADGGLMDVVVHVSGGLGDWTYPAPAGGQSLDQKGCSYLPHVLALRAGETFQIINSDDTLHNINVQPSDNPAFNQGQPVAGMTRDTVFENPETAIPARCDVHPWMSAFIHVFGHPYFALSTADGGFSIADLPPGEYVIEAWHATLGTQTQSITVAPNETAEASIAF